MGVVSEQAVKSMVYLVMFETCTIAHPVQSGSSVTEEDCDGLYIIP